MKSEFELIQYNGSLPARITINHGKTELKSHWHKEIELIYVAEGQLTVTVNSQSQTVGADGVFLINSSENHSLTGDNASFVVLDISYEFAQKFNNEMQNTLFVIVGGSGAEEEVRNLMWQLYRTGSDDELPELRQYSIITELLHVLLVQCKRLTQGISKDGEQITSRHIKLAAEYIEKHYREEFEETEIASMLGLHPIYFSSLFKQSTGIGFRDYVLKIRLQHAMDALLKEHMSIEDAAKAGGFPSKRTFIAKCKRAYNITPFQILKQNKK